MHYFRRMMEFDEQVALCALNKIFGYHPRLAMALMEEAGSAAALFDGKWKAPGQAGNDGMPDRASHPELLAQLVPSMLEWAQGELSRIRKQGFRFLGYTDPDYPAPLREIPDPPLGLYLNGSTPPTQIFDLHPMVGVVGTRDLSPYGRAWCRKLVEGLARARVQPCIVSGMALAAWRWGPMASPTRQPWSAASPPLACCPRVSTKCIPGSTSAWPCKWWGRRDAAW